MSDRQIQTGDYFKLIYPTTLSTYFRIIEINILENEIQIVGQNLLNSDNIETIEIDSKGIYTIKGKSENFMISFSSELSSRQLLLTGIKDIDINILLQLDNKDLVNICQTDSYAADLCRDENLWKTKLYREFIDDDLRFLAARHEKYINPSLTWRDNYINFSKYMSKVRLGIREAIIDNDIEYLKFITSVDDDLLTSLNYSDFRTALYNGSIDVLDWMITFPHIGQHLIGGTTRDPQLLLVVAQSDNVDSYIWLQKKGLEMRFRQALEYGSINILKYMESQQPGYIDEALRRTGSVNIENTLSSAINRKYFEPVVSQRRIEFFQYILEKVVSLGIVLNFKRGILSRAIESGDINILKMLYEYLNSRVFAHLKMKSQTPAKDSIIHATRNGYAEIIRYLVEKEPDLVLNRSVANKALEYGHLDILKILSEHEVYPDSPRSFNRALDNRYFDTIEWIAENPNQPLGQRAIKYLKTNI